MSRTPDTPHHDPAGQDADTPFDDRPAGGWGSLKGVSRFMAEPGRKAEALEVLSKLNKPGGVMCTACAWTKPEGPHKFEFCESGAKATFWELDGNRADAAFFADHSVSDLRGWHDHDLEKAGRLTEPLRYDAESDRYLPVSWEAAFAEIGAGLRAVAPEEAVFYASGHAGLEASYLYALFARAMGHQNLPQS
jgi:anaerobic selenocysteine-containing dehydrogenase